MQPHLEDYFPVLTLKGKRLFLSRPVNFLAQSYGDRDEVKTLHIVLIDDESTNNRSIESRVEEVNKDIRYVKSTTRIEPLNAKAAIDQLTYLLRSTAGYVALANPRGFEDFRFIRPPYKAFDKYRKSKRKVSEELQMICLTL